MKSINSRDRYNVEAVQRFAQICGLFTPERPQLDIHDIARLSTIPLRTAKKITATLVARDFLARDGESGSWVLGPAWLRFADCKRSQIDLRAASIPIIHWMREQLNETIMVAIRHGDRRVVIECMVSTQPIRRVSEIGDETPIHVGSSGRTMLAGWKDDEITQYLQRTKLINYGYDTVTDPARIWSDIRKSRRDGYLTARAEITKESFSSSAAIRSYSGEVIAAVTITFPLSRLTDELRDRSIHLATEGAKRISRRLGYGATPLSRREAAS